MDTWCDTGPLDPRSRPPMPGGPPKRHCIRRSDASMAPLEALTPTRVSRPAASIAPVALVSHVIESSCSVFAAPPPASRVVPAMSFAPRLSRLGTLRRSVARQDAPHA